MLSLMQGYLSDVKSELFRESSRLSPAALCRRMNIAEGPDEYLKPQNAGLLFFSDDPEKFFPGARIDVVEFVNDK